jgi:hypothetical protein
LKVILPIKVNGKSIVPKCRILYKKNLLFLAKCKNQDKKYLFIKTISMNIFWRIIEKYENTRLPLERLKEL